MFGKRSRSASRMARASLMVQATAGLEYLEGRQLLSSSHGVPRGGGWHAVQQVAAIEFSAAPSAVQTGLDTLATTDGLTDPAGTQTVTLHNVGGVETYSVSYSSTGTKSTLTVDQNGNAVTVPTTTTTTFGTLSGTGTGSDAAAATEISAIATALGLTAPTSTTTVNVTTTSGGAVVYSVALSSSSMSTTSYAHSSVVSVDASGNPVGNQNLPLSVIPTTIASALSANAPSGATALTSSSIVHVQTIDGITLYSAIFDSAGVDTTVTVNAAGTLTSLPSETTTTFSTLSSAVQTELQTLATANGFASTISATQTINVYTEANGTVLYSATLTTSSGTTTTYPMSITVTSDAAGNPTTLPGGFGGRGGPEGPDGGGCGDRDGSTTTFSSGTTTTTGTTPTTTSTKTAAKKKKK
jgi:hypothetical protein